MKVIMIYGSRWLLSHLCGYNNNSNTVREIRGHSHSPEFSMNFMSSVFGMELWKLLRRWNAVHDTASKILKFVKDT